MLQLQDFFCLDLYISCLTLDTDSIHLMDTTRDKYHIMCKKFPCFQLPSIAKNHTRKIFIKLMKNTGRVFAFSVTETKLLIPSPLCCSIFTCKSSYFFSASSLSQFSLFILLSVCPSVTRVDQPKTVQARITKSSLSSAWKTLVSGSVKLFHKFHRGHPEH